MVKQIFVNGFPLAHDNHRHIIGLQGLTSSSIDLTTNNRGGQNGITLGQAFYRNRVFSIELLFLASNPIDLLKEKDRTLTNFRLKHTNKTQTILIEFKLFDDSIRSCRAIVKDIKGNLTPKNSFNQKVVIQLVADRWYLEGKQHSVFLSRSNFGGMSIPMAMPMNMSVLSTNSNSYQVINNGNTESTPTVNFVGPMNGIDLYNHTTNTHMNINKNLQENETLDLDFFKHTAILNQVENIRGKVTGNWFQIAPGQNDVLFISNGISNNSIAKIEYPDAFMGI